MNLSLLFPAIMCGVFCYLGAIESCCLMGMTGGSQTSEDGVQS